MRAGDLSELTGNMVATNPFVPAGCVDAANKIISQSCFDPVATRLMGLFPMPNVPGAGFFNNNFISNGILNNDVDQFDVRIDHNLSAGSDHLFARYSFQNTDRHEPPLLDDPVASGDFASDILNRGQSAVAGWSRVFGVECLQRAARLVQQGPLGRDSPGIRHRLRTRSTESRACRRIRGSTAACRTCRSRASRASADRSSARSSRIRRYCRSPNNLSWQKGSHALKFGGEFRRDMLHYIDLRSLNGELNFNDGRYTGFGLGDFLLGLSSAQRLTLFHEPDLYANGWQFYAQDSWRVRSNVTITAGIRYEMFTPMLDRNNLLTNIDPATGAVFYAKDGSVFDRALIHPDRDDIAPRVGVTWSVTPTVVLRGGWGVFYQQTDRYGSESQLGLNLPQLVDASITANSGADAPAFTFAQGFTPLTPQTVNPAVVQWRIQDPNQDTPVVQQFSVGPEFQFAENMVGAVEYVGNRTRNGRRLRNLNEGIITGNTVTFPFAPQGYGNAYLEQIVTNGNADYDALQMRMQRRMTRGLAYTVAYTWSKAQGDFLDHLSAGGGATGNAPGSTYAMDKDYGLLAFDIPHRLVTSFIYELPIGEGRTFNPDGVCRSNRPRLVGQRHPDAERRPPVHGDDDGPGADRTGTHRARELPRRCGAGRLQPDHRFVDGSGGVRADHGQDLRRLPEQHGARTGLEVDEPVGVPIDRARRRQARGIPPRDVQPFQLGELRFPGGEYFEPGNLRSNHHAASATSERFSSR